MIDPELLELHESTVQLAPPSARALDGGTTWGTAVDYQAHVESKRMMVRNAAGELMLATGRVFLVDVYPALTELYQLTLPDGSKRKVVAIETTYDRSGPYQNVIYY